MSTDVIQLPHRLGFIRRYQLLIFFVVSVVLGSLLTWLVANIPASPILIPLLAFPISYVPAVTAILLVRLGGTEDERGAFRWQLTHWRTGFRWYAVALFILPLIAVMAVALTTLWGGQIPFQPQMFALLPLFLITNSGEEIGWRGYALPRLQARFNSLTASLILGGVWAVFHWVALWQNPTLPWAYMIVGTIYLIAMSVVMTWVFNHVGGSIVVMVLMHAMYDVVAIGVMPLLETNRPLLGFALGAGIACAVAVALVVGQGVNLGKPEDFRLFVRANTPGGNKEMTV